jgi:muramidase (phage lysozyme)
MKPLKSNWIHTLLLSGIAVPALVLLLVTTTKKSNRRAVVGAMSNLRAFLVMIQYAEGTYGKEAYRTLFGGQLFTGFEDHPAIAITRSGLTSTAAGAYQILFRTWQSLKQTVRLDDFSPANQDRAAIELIRRRGALEDVLAGRLESALTKCRKEWASLPGAGYGQREHSSNTLAAVYKSAGGSIIS